MNLKMLIELHSRPIAMEPNPEGSKGPIVCLVRERSLRYPIRAPLFSFSLDGNHCALSGNLVILIFNDQELTRLIASNNFGLT